jgi:hypothetical protein
MAKQGPPKDSTKRRFRDCLLRMSGTATRDTAPIVQPDDASSAGLDTVFLQHDTATL